MGICGSNQPCQSSFLGLFKFEAWRKKKHARGQGKENRPEKDVSGNCHAIKRETKRESSQKQKEESRKAGGRDTDKGKRPLMRAELSLWTNRVWGSHKPINPRFCSRQCFWLDFCYSQHREPGYNYPAAFDFENLLCFQS